MAFLGYRQEELERQFNPRVAVPNHGEQIAARSEASARVRERLKAELDLRYGPGPKETLDIFPAAVDSAPVQLYVHGGYWRANDKSDVSFMAEPLVAAGATVVLINHDLCPDVGVGDIVEQVRRAIAWTYRHKAEHGGDPDQIYISGNSAGAHLCAMALAHDWEAKGLPADLIKGATLITGVYDLEPVLHISVNQDVRLDPEAARRLSPMFLPPRRPLPPRNRGRRRRD